MSSPKFAFTTRNALYPLVVLLFVCIFSSCGLAKTHYTLSSPVSQIAAVDIIDLPVGTPCEFASARDAEVLVSLEPEEFSNFAEQLQGFRCHQSFNDPEYILAGRCFRIMYDSGDYELVFIHCVALFLGKDTHRIKFINNTYSDADFNDLLRRYGITP